MRDVIYISYRGFSFKSFEGSQLQKVLDFRASIEVSFAVLLFGQLVCQFFDLVRS